LGSIIVFVNNQPRERRLCINNKMISLYVFEVSKSVTISHLEEPKANWRIEMFQNQHILFHMRPGESDHDLARAGVVGGGAKLAKPANRMESLAEVKWNGR